MNKPYQLQLTPEQMLTHQATIVSGLLAGGHPLEEEEGINASAAVVAACVLRELMMNIEGEIKEGDTDHYIDEGDYERPILPGSDRDRRAKWLKNPVEKQP
jgi:hypothetical protein